ncbi:hypothetical protein GE061_006878 [Apolygus lucorum]|uniref:Uncharacterized protein n=1 Tax=Apolygus lucorum TaxID=248454 RepID=A0A8S9WTY3_APOLU|nr:hypothetical protein GE061_006878 [Apolygus lucorum]
MLESQERSVEFVFAPETAIKDDCVNNVLPEWRGGSGGTFLRVFVLICTCLRNFNHKIRGGGGTGLGFV